MSKPELELSTEDGNIFYIIGRAIKVARRAGWTEIEIRKFREEAESGDYDNALQVCMKYFDVI